ncbi:hypothetical protein HPB49_024651 [Dermacentor silvarum]|uniref:Uncharacterized protein n=1 Tax=Dermacentor silvarum TaxID=543639 RepID=A0ACB8CIF1_DERSI|nr:hypothetical protein HPB49_024651 [Dermacentor silvarum]
MSDEDEEEESVAGDLGPAYLTMGVTASVLRAYHRIARMLRKAWTDMRFEALTQPQVRVCVKALELRFGLYEA